MCVCELQTQMLVAAMTRVSATGAATAAVQCWRHGWEVKHVSRVACEADARHTKVQATAQGRVGGVWSTTCV